MKIITITVSILFLIRLSYADTQCEKSIKRYDKIIKKEQKLLYNSCPKLTADQTANEKVVYDAPTDGRVYFIYAFDRNQDKYDINYDVLTLLCRKADEVDTLNEGVTGQACTIMNKDQLKKALEEVIKP